MYDQHSNASNALREGNFQVTTSPDRACVFLVVVDDPSGAAKLESAVEKLSHWNGDGRNHVLMSSRLDLSAKSVGRALVAQPGFYGSGFRPGFDVVTPFATEEIKETWRELPDMFPVHRKYLISFEGRLKKHSADADDSGSSLLLKILNLLKDISDDDTDDKSFIDQECPETDTSLEKYSLAGEMLLCHDRESRKKVLSESTFALIVAPSSGLATSSIQFQTRLMEALR